MSTTSMGWQPVVEAPGSKLAEAMAMRLLEQKLQSPEDEWRRQLAERQFGLQEREAESRMGLGERTATLGEKQHGLDVEKFKENVWQYPLEAAQRSRGQDIEERKVGASEAYHAGLLELQKMQKEDTAKWRDKKLELEGIRLELEKQALVGKLHYQNDKLSIEGVEHAREVMKEGMRVLVDPVAQAMMQRTPGMREQLEERVQWAASYLARAQKGGVLEKSERFGRQPSPVRQALEGGGTKEVPDWEKKYWSARGGKPAGQAAKGSPLTEGTSLARQALEELRSRGQIANDATYEAAKKLSDSQLESFLSKLAARKRGGQ